MAERRQESRNWKEYDRELQAIEAAIQAMTDSWRPLIDWAAALAEVGEHWAKMVRGLTFDPPMVIDEANLLPENDFLFRYRVGRFGYGVGPISKELPPYLVSGIS